MKKHISFFALALLAAMTLICLPSHAQSLGDTIVFGGPGNCGGNVSANFVVGAAAGAGTGLQAVGTNFTPVYQVSSSAAATDIISCGFGGMSRTTPGKGLNAVAGIAFFYGIVTTTATSENAPICAIQTMPAPGAAETASAAAGTVVPQTSIPVIGSANLIAITTGQFYTQFLAFTTAQAFNGLYQSFSCSFSFGQAGAAAMVVNTPGYVVFTTNTIVWLKQHGHDGAVAGLRGLGISKETAELIFAHYVPKDAKAKAYMAMYNARQAAKVTLANGPAPPPTCDLICQSMQGSGGTPPPGVSGELISYGPRFRQ